MKNYVLKQHLLLNYKKQCKLSRKQAYLTVLIIFTENLVLNILNKEQKEALRKFSETVGENNYEKRKSFFKKK